MCRIFKYSFASFLILLSAVIYKIHMNQPEDRIELYHTNKHSKNMENNKEIYDYIVIGAGSSGSVVASRLSERENLKVLLLEAGGSDNYVNMQIPALFTHIFGTEADWRYSSTYQTLAKYQHVFIPRGKSLGGSSAMSAMMYVRGSPQDYNNWERLGNKGWSFKDVLPYFKKSEKHLNPSRNTTHHGSSGNMKVSTNSHRTILSDYIYNATKKLYNLEYIEDFNSLDSPKAGISGVDSNIVDGVRVNVADAYLNKEVLQRENLFVRTYSHVKKILFDENKKAIGVEVFYTETNITDFIYTKKEVICSAGTINSPQLLQLSGVGPNTLLSGLNISIVHSNDFIGQNLHDHPVITNLFQLNQTLSSLSLHNFQHFPYDFLSLLQWFFFGTGPLVHTSIEMNGFFHSSLNKKNKSDWPDMQIISMRALYRHPEKENFDDVENGGYTIAPILVAPKSRGVVILRSEDFQDPPRIDFNLYSNKDDFQKMVEAFKNVRNILNYDENLKKVTKGEYYAEESLKTDHEIEDYIKLNTLMMYNPVGTCAMGNVVDEKLRVKGITGLRVIDASIIPEIVRGNINAACVMIGEKGADMILNDN